MDKKFDTSGSVSGTVWSDLSPFAQGYVEALMTDPTIGHRIYGLGRAFRYLAPETLSRIIADCEGYQRRHADLIGISVHPEGLPRLGRLFWINRQNGSVASMPSLTVQLGEDGKVVFAV